MTIPHFADQQNLVFLPALGAGLAATILICLPIVFAPALRRGRPARRRALAVVGFGLAAVALVVAGWQAGLGVRTLQAERTAVAEAIRTEYRIDLSGGQVGELLDGGAPKVLLPEQATALGIANPRIAHALRLKATAPGADTYDLAFGGKVLTPSA